MEDTIYIGENITDSFKKSQAERILSLYSDQIEKAGAGARGGHVIGHTTTGKTIYYNSKHPQHAGFSDSEHAEAAKMRKDHAFKGTTYAADKKEPEKPEDEENGHNSDHDDQKYKDWSHHDHMSEYHKNQSAAGKAKKEGKESHISLANEAAKHKKYADLKKSEDGEQPEGSIE